MWLITAIRYQGFTTRAIITPPPPLLVRTGWFGQTDLSWEYTAPANNAVMKEVFVVRFRNREWKFL